MPRKFPSVIGYVMVNGQRMDVLADLPLIQFMDDLENSSDNTSINTLLAGINTVSTTTSGIIDGTVAIDPTITGRGSLADELDSTGSNLAATATAAGAGALAASVSPTYAFGQSGAGLVTTNAVVVTATGGTAPYTYAWTRKSGSVLINVDAATSATTSFSDTLTAGQSLAGIWTCTVTDALSATTTVDVPVTLDAGGA